MEVKYKINKGDTLIPNMSAEAFNAILALAGSERRVEPGDPVDKATWREFVQSIHKIHEWVSKRENQA